MCLVYHCVLYTDNKPRSSFLLFPICSLSLPVLLPLLPHLILSELPGHVLLGPLQCVLQVSGPSFGFFHRQLSSLLRLSQLVLQTATLTDHRDKEINSAGPESPREFYPAHLNTSLYLYLRLHGLYLALQSADQAVDLGHLSLHQAEFVSVLARLHRHLVELQTEEGRH